MEEIVQYINCYESPLYIDVASSYDERNYRKFEIVYGATGKRIIDILIGVLECNDPFCKIVPRRTCSDPQCLEDKDRSASQYVIIQERIKNLHPETQPPPELCRSSNTPYT